MFDVVDPFIGTEATDLPTPTGLAASWWPPKPLVGNTHPGATHPLGMVSACAYSGAYPTGYGRYDLSLEGLPPVMHDELVASGVTHFQQSGTGAIRKYYNYVRVTPMLRPLDDLGTLYGLSDERAEPGWYAATLSNGVRLEVTVGPKSAVHRYTFPRHTDARVVLDFSLGGLAIPYGATVPLRAHLQSLAPGVAAGEVVVEGAPLAVHVECDTPQWRQMLWYDRRLMPGGTRLDFDRIRPTTLRPFGLMWAGPSEPGEVVELRIGFSLRGVDQARRNLEADCGTGVTAFDSRRAATAATWREHLGKVSVDGPAPRTTVLGTALYHSLIKPSFAHGESPFWPTPGPFAFDISTMWDIYRTQLPLLTTLLPDRAVELGEALLHICEEEGNFPIGYRMARGADRFSRQASALAHTFLADLAGIGLSMDWEWALVHLHNDLRRSYGEEYLQRGRAEPITHTLDLAFGYWCTARVAQRLGDLTLLEQFEPLAAGWVNAFGGTGLLRDSTFYEGGAWNYSFRLLHDMAARIRLSGGDSGFVDQLDAFFGFGAAPVTWPGLQPSATEMAEGYALCRFEGLNNEPDMEAPWAYMYAGRPDRTAEVVHHAVHQMFGTGRGGLPGNDDSGGLSSWYVWASLGLFPVAGQSLWLLNAPSWREARLAVGDRELTIDTEGFVEPEHGGAPQFVRSVRLDGQALDRTWITGTELHRGGHLVLELGPEPSGWGTAVKDRPPSQSTGGPFPSLVAGPPPAPAPLR
ncbi:glycoside hydrolase family 92 protein [Actinotalea sp. M2MS4P-6]|uniref:glycoside hydrolase domain-containing protein n=1 Tax=Actinotalea sp. M2MS4P-6 TaxID=2983762 RepID=UPI0021E43DAD|nr:glycoside hydrolase domain-containing protein [Actinotalea sp. M2MS4P-6]MCV2396017.1 glycoside hydrolase family 92 protein [Actinotalea sp. M2MS4P-6]